jgi:acetylornithine deacetylase/succinyl-diaminopimelate desuccinylase-like protein
MPSLTKRFSLTCILSAALLAACSDTVTQTTPQDMTKPQAAAPQTPVEIGDGHMSAITALKTQPAILAAFKTIESHRNENNRDMVTLNEIPAPPFGEATRGKRVAEMFRDAGLTDVTIDAVGNVIGRRPGVSGEKTIALGAHIDTVFPIETDVTVRREGDTYIAPGIGDNTRGVIVLLSLIKALEAHDIETEHDLMFVGNIGEEGLGDLRGIKHLYRDGAPKIDSFIAVDGGRDDRLVYGGVGSYRYRVTFKGPGGHSWGDFGDANPHHALGRATTIFSERAAKVASQGPKTSFNIGRIGGGTSINSIPFESWMEVDMRSGNVEKLDDMDAVFKQAMAEGLAAENAARTSGDEITVEVKKVGDRPVANGDASSPLVQQSLAAIRSFGLDPKLAISSTDANTPISKGLPAVTISRGGKSAGAHSFEETWTDKDSHVAIQIALLIALEQAEYIQP